MEAPNNIILPALILIPFIAGFICWLVDKLDQHLPRYIALIGMLVTLVLTIVLGSRVLIIMNLAVRLLRGQPSSNCLGFKPWALTFTLRWMVYLY